GGTAGEAGAGGEGGVIEGGAGGEGGAVPGEAGAAGAAGAPPVAELVCQDDGNYPSGDGATCEVFCEDFFTNCAGTTVEDAFADEAECLAACEALPTVKALCCRAAHAAEAGTEVAEVHCQAIVNSCN